MIHFHRVLIASAILFCAGFALRSLMAWQSGNDTVSLVLGISFGLATVVFAYYLVHLRRFLRL